MHGRGLGEPATSAPGQDQPESEGRTGLRINARSENAITAALTIAITDRMDESDHGSLKTAWTKAITDRFFLFLKEAHKANARKIRIPTAASDIAPSSLIRAEIVAH